MVSCIDCLFDMLDYSQWKNDNERWLFFKHLLLNIEKTNELKECINENWNIRKSFWPSYHFYGFKNTELHINKAIVGACLMGPGYCLKL